MRTRREFLTVALGAGAALAPRWAGAAPKAMSVLHESSFIKPFDEFFVKKLAPEYERLTGIKINYEPVSVGSLLTRMTTVAETRSGPEITATGSTGPGSSSRASSTSPTSPAMSARDSAPGTTASRTPS